MKKISLCLACLALILSLFAAPMASVADAAEIGAELLDVVFVVDGSGSMIDNDPDKIALEACELFSQICVHEKTRVGFVMFTDEIVKTIDVTPLTSEDDEQSDAERLASILADITNSSYKKGWTNISLGLDTANDLLNAAPKTDDSRKTLLILLSDGETAFDYDHSSTEKYEAAELLLDEALGTATLQDTPIYCVGLNADGSLNMAALEDIAHQTNAQAWEITDIAELRQVISDIYSDFTNSEHQTIADFVSDGTSNTVYFDVPNNSIYEANIIILYGDRITDIHLKNPDGQEIAIPSDTVYYSESNYHAILKLRYPKAGEWALSVTGVEEDHITINMIQYYDMQLDIHTADDIRRDIPNSLRIAIADYDGTLLNSSRMSNVTATASFTSDRSGKVTDVPLSFDGEVLSGGFTLDEIGPYTLNAEISSTEGFAREVEISMDCLAQAVLPVRESRSGLLLTEFLGLPVGSRSAYTLDELFTWDDTASYSLYTDIAGDSVEVYADEDSRLVVEATSMGKSSVEFRLVDSYGQSGSAVCNYLVLPSWLVLLALLAILASLYFLIRTLRWRSMPDLQGTLSVEVNLPARLEDQTPPKAEIILDSIRNAKGAIGLDRLLASDVLNGTKYLNILFELGKLLSGITCCAADKDCKSIRVYLPAGSNGFRLFVNGLQCDRAETLQLSGGTGGFGGGFGGGDGGTGGQVRFSYVNDAEEHFAFTLTFNSNNQSGPDSSTPFGDNDGFGGGFDGGFGGGFGGFDGGFGGDSSFGVIVAFLAAFFLAGSCCFFFGGGVCGFGCCFGGFGGDSGFGSDSGWG